MNSEQMLKVKKIIERAEAHKGNTATLFKKLKKELSELGLKPEELTRLTRTVGEKMGV